MRKLFRLLLCFVLICPLYGQVQNPSNVELKDESVSQGRVVSINFAGSSIVCTVSGFAGTCTISGGGAFGVLETEIDFDTDGIGGTGHFETCSVVVTDAGVSGSSRVLALQAGIAATSRDIDENEMDQLICTTQPAAGSFTLVCTSQQGPTHGKFKIYYVIG